MRITTILNPAKFFSFLIFVASLCSDVQAAGCPSPEYHHAVLELATLSKSRVAVYVQGEPTPFVGDIHDLQADPQTGTVTVDNYEIPIREINEVDIQFDNSAVKNPAEKKTAVGNPAARANAAPATHEDPSVAAARTQEKQAKDDREILDLFHITETTEKQKREAIQRRVEELAQNSQEDLAVKVENPKDSPQGAKIEGYTQVIRGNGIHPDLRVEVPAVQYTYPVDMKGFVKDFEGIRLKKIQELEGPRGEKKTAKIKEFEGKGYNSKEALDQYNRFVKKNLETEMDRLFVEKLRASPEISGTIGAPFEKYGIIGGGFSIIIKTSEVPPHIFAVPRPFQISAAGKLEAVPPATIAKTIQFKELRREALAKILEGGDRSWRIPDRSKDPKHVALFQKYGIDVREYGPNRNLARIFFEDEADVQKLENEAVEAGPNDNAQDKRQKAKEARKAYRKRKAAAQKLALNFNDDVSPYDLDIIAIGQVRYGMVNVQSIGGIDVAVGIDRESLSNMTEAPDSPVMVRSTRRIPVLTGDEDLQSSSSSGDESSKGLVFDY